MKHLLIAVALALTATTAHAEVVDAQPGGFEVKRTAVLNAPADRVYAALAQPSQWWSKDHTWSGSSAGLSLAPMAGGCFCEKLLNGGSVMHMTVVYAQPGRGLRLFGALGPLQMSGAAGHLGWTLSETDGKTTLIQTYDVGGYMKGGLDKIAPAVDQVLSEQFDRLTAYVETGKAP
ncbi:ATPase [Caulobacter sp. Root487D2Y]|uniref:SRPBCC family protein n=1 Tax=Caulobacter sp. Root487D2Y TaxID=1736547 RepID=UPI0006FBA03C|nr:SRPBCC family protein [Caulobacter sp. Root487D2Y]KQY35316.1 ATPase [Caulobacter sp. Root487D2Y]